MRALHCSQLEWSSGLRDSAGAFIASKNMKISGVVIALEAEAIGVHEALIWMEERSTQQQMVIETDSLQVANALNKNSKYLLMH